MTRQLSMEKPTTSPGVLFVFPPDESGLKDRTSPPALDVGIETRGSRRAWIGFNLFSFSFLCFVMNQKMRAVEHGTP